MRLAFFGAGAFAIPTLHALCDEHDVPLVVSQPDRPAGRKRRLTPTPLAQWAQKQGLQVIKPQDANAPQTLRTIRAAQTEVHIVVAFGQKLGDAVMELPSWGRGQGGGTINLHASLLPKYRGAAPVQWAILSGERTTGNTVIRMTERMDAGDILGHQTTPIDSRETAGELHDRLAALGPELVLDVLKKIADDDLNPLVQDESQASRAPKLSRGDGGVDFAQSADQVRRRVHGLTPRPGVRVQWSRADESQRHMLLLRRVQALPDVEHHQPPGVLIKADTAAAGEGAVRLLEVQPPGKRTMSWRDFANGQRLEPGAMLHATES